MNMGDDRILTDEVEEKAWKQHGAWKARQARAVEAERRRREEYLHEVGCRECPKCGAVIHCEEAASWSFMSEEQVAKAHMLRNRVAMAKVEVERAKEELERYVGKSAAAREAGDLNLDDTPF